MRLLAMTVAIYFLGTPLIWCEEGAHMTGPELMACSVALDKFKVDEVKSDIRNYSIHITESPETYEVIFVPNSTPLKETEPGRVELNFGGGTIFGREVHYIISKDMYKVLRTFFGR